MGLVTNADRDLRMSPVERAAAATAERQDAVIQGAIEKGRESGVGAVARPSAEGSQTTVTDAHAGFQDEFQTSQSLQVHPTWKYDPDTMLITSKVYPGAEYDAVMAGEYCRNCDLLQEDKIPIRSEVVVPAWDSAVCLTVTGVSCGCPRRGELPFKVLSIN